MTLKIEDMQNEIESYMNVESISSVSWENQLYKYVLLRKKLKEEAKR